MSTAEFTPSALSLSNMSTRSVQVGGQSLTLCLDCGALLDPSQTSKHNAFHKQFNDLSREVKELRSSAKN